MAIENSKLDGANRPIVIGVDIGGTFTDLVAYHDGKLLTAKVPTTPEDPSEGFMQALTACGIDLSAVKEISHGTTIATNALIERKVTKCGLITTRGFRDVLAMRRRDRRKPYGIETAFVPLIPRAYRLEVPERAGPDGVVEPVATESVLEAAERLWEAGVEAIVVSFLHAAEVESNEREATCVLRSKWKDRSVIGAVEVCREPREFERTSTAVASACVTPLIRDYLKRLTDNIEEAGFRGDLRIVTSDGGVVSPDEAGRTAIRTALSGPAAGVRGAQALSQKAGIDAFVACDMGGTSFDACIVSDGTPALTLGREIDFGIPIAIPSLDIATLGAGGGSIARLDAWGGVEVGPDGVGAFPGPACYGKQRIHPTVMDANLILGRLGERLRLPDGERMLELEASRRTVHERIARGLEISVEEAATGILDVVNGKMAECIRLLSLEKRIPLDEVVLISYGGSGPLHAAEIARELGIDRVLVPNRAGTFSAWGSLLSQARETRSEPVALSVDERGMEVLAKKMGDQKSELEESSPTTNGEARFIYEVEVSYLGQSSASTLEMASYWVSAESMRSDFESRQEAFGVRMEGYPLSVHRVATTRIIDLGDPNRSCFERRVVDSPIAMREAWFGSEAVPCPVHDLDSLKPGRRIEGPAIVEEPGSTILVPPDSRAWLEEDGTMWIET